jgi:predicted DNA-binding transcriptional regulator AlpA
MQNTPTTPDVDAQIEICKQFLTDKEGAYLLGISRTTFRKLVSTGQLPPPIKFGACARWERGALMTAAALLQRSTTNNKR